MAKYSVYKKVNMFTQFSAGGYTHIEVPVLEKVLTAHSIPEAADKLAKMFEDMAILKPLNWEQMQDHYIVEDD